jgi:vitamin B12 transporter
MILYWPQRLTSSYRFRFIARVLISLTGTWVLLLSSVQAQSSDHVYPMEGVEIYSDRLGLSETRTGRHTTVITGEDIKKLPVNSIDELLRTIPFLETQARGAFGVQSDILMRGGTFNQVLVLIDGMRINDPLTGHFNSYIPVSISEISRIEVYRGPASSLYGPDAVGGVIHIVTKSFLPGEGVDQMEGQIETWYGQNDLFRVNSGLHISKGRFRLGTGLSINKSEGHILDQDTLRGDFRLGTASLGVSYRITENIEAGIRTAYDSRLFNARYFYTNSPLDVSREQVNKWWNQMFIRIRLNSSSTLTLQGGYQSTADSFLFNPIFPANTHRTQYQNYQANYLFRSVSGFRLSSGIQADQKKITSSDRGNHEYWHSGAYLVLSGNILRYGTVSGGMRLDYDPVYGLEVLPQMNIAWTVDGWLLRGSFGRSVRSPDFSERYISTGLTGPLSPGRNIGNPLLAAERSWSIEAGVERNLIEGVRLKTTVFNRFSRDLIDYVMTPSDEIVNNQNLSPGESYFWTRNIGLLNTLGIEAQLEGLHAIVGKSSLEWGVSYQALSSKNKSDLVTKYLSAHARNLIHTRIGVSNSSLKLQLNSLYKSRDDEFAENINESIESSYLIFDIRTDLFLYEKRIRLSLQVNNLFNRKYSDILGARMPGRWLSGGLAWKFTDKNHSFTD